MNRRRIFVLVNLALTAVCGLLVYYIANAAYVKPPEIANAQEILDRLGPDLPAQADESVRQSPVPANSLRVCDPLITLTPQATETPRPSPTPLPLKQMIQTWTINSLDEKEAIVKDGKSGEEFTMQLKGAPHKIEIEGAPPLLVTLCQVDLDNATATFCCGDQQESKSF